jgi:cyclophilin family peptidyl-prolyl cis-trans isomerase
MAQQEWPAPPAMQIDVAKDYAVSIETNRGTIELTLYPQHAPQTVNNFVFLAEQGFYDGVKFHRVIADFMIQTGDPTGTGRGGPGYRFADECKGNPLKHERGVISMANAGPNTNGSQFFLISGPSGIRLPPQYNHFGKIVEGLDVLDTMQKVPTGPGDRPREDVVINSVTITEA